MFAGLASQSAVGEAEWLEGGTVVAVAYCSKTGRIRVLGNDTSPEVGGMSAQKRNGGKGDR